MSRTVTQDIIDRMLRDSERHADTESAQEEDVLAIAAEDLLAAVKAGDADAVARCFKAMSHLARGAASKEPDDDEPFAHGGEVRGPTARGRNVRTLRR